MIDIVSAGVELGVLDSQTPKAGNVLSVQIGALEYAPNLGIDVKYFLDENFKVQNDSFKAYLIEVLANNSINITSVLDVLENLFANYIFNIKPPESTGGSLIAR